MPRHRLGVALLLPAHQAAEVDALRSALGTSEADRFRIAPHLTLVPPVNVREEALPEVYGLLSALAAETRPLKVTLGPPTTFLPPTSVLYLAVNAREEAQEADDDVIARLRRLRDGAFQPPLSRPMGRPFVPHVTLHEHLTPPACAAAITALGHAAIDVTFRGVHLMEQFHGDQYGSMWRPRQDWAFSEPAVVARGGLELSLTESDSPPPDALRIPGVAEWTACAPMGQPLTVTARRGDDVVGCTLAVFRGEVAELRGVIVVEGHRREGIGRHLLGRMASLLHDRGAWDQVGWAPRDPGVEGFLRALNWMPDRSHGGSGAWPAADGRQRWTAAK